MLSDISALAYNYRYEYKKIQQLPVNTFSNDWSVDVFVRFPQSEAIAIGDFEDFKSGYADNEQNYMLGSLPFRKLEELSRNENVGVILSPNAKLINANECAEILSLAF